MPDTETLLSFVTTALLLLVSPGPAVAYLGARTIAQGLTAGFASSLGLCAGLLVHVVGAVAGVSALLLRWPLALQGLQLAGGAYLLWLAWATLRSGPTVSGDGEIGPECRPLWRLFWDGVLVDTLNPKPALFFLAFLPQFVPQDPAHSSHLQLLFLGVVFVALALFINSAYVLVFARLGAGFNHSKRLAKCNRYASAGFLFVLSGFAVMQGTGWHR